MRYLVGIGAAAVGFALIEKMFFIPALDAFQEVARVLGH